MNAHVFVGVVRDKDLVPPSLPQGNRFRLVHLTADIDFLLPEAPGAEMADLRPHVDPTLAVLDDLQRDRTLGVSDLVLGAAILGENLFQPHECMYVCRQEISQSNNSTMLHV